MYIPHTYLPTSTEIPSSPTDGGELCSDLPLWDKFILLDGDEDYMDKQPSSKRMREALKLTANSVAREISIAEYNALRNPCLSAHVHSEQGQLVIVYEVAFGPKGQHETNLSLWFNTPAIKLRCRQLKQKKKVQIRNEHSHPNANGALISHTCSADFPNHDPDIR